MRRGGFDNNNNNNNNYNNRMIMNNNNNNQSQTNAPYRGSPPRGRYFPRGRGGDSIFMRRAGRGRGYDHRRRGRGTMEDRGRIRNPDVYNNNNNNNNRNMQRYDHGDERRKYVDRRRGIRGMTDQGRRGRGSPDRRGRGRGLNDRRRIIMRGSPERRGRIIRGRGGYERGRGRGFNERERGGYERRRGRGSHDTRITRGSPDSRRGIRGRGLYERGRGRGRGGSTGNFNVGKNYNTVPNKIVPLTQSWRYVVPENCEYSYHNYYLVDSEKGAKYAFNALNNSKRIAFDIEGKKLSRIGEILTLQMGSMNKRPLVYDMIKLKKIDGLIEKYIKPILESTLIQKITFDCRVDSDAIFHQFGIKLTNVLDLQVFHQGIMIAHHKENFSLEKNRYVHSMGKLLKFYYVHDDKKKFNTDWVDKSEEDLKKEEKIDFLLYASQDVELILKLYNAMKNRSEKNQMSNELMERVLKGSKKYTEVDRDSEEMVDNLSLNHKIIIPI